MPPGSPLRIALFALGRQLQPLAGGELRIHHLACEMALRGHAVDLFSFVLRNHPAGEARPTPNLRIRQQHLLPLDLATLLARARIIPLVSLPLWLRGLRRRIAHWTAATPYDIVQFEFPWFVEVYGAVRGSGRILYSAHNIESHYWAARGAARPSGRWLRRLERWETRAAGRAAGVIACTEEDRAWLAERGGLEPRRTIVIPNGYDARGIQPPTGEERLAARRVLGLAPEEKLILFIGHDTAPNREAAAFLLDMMQARPSGAPWRLGLVGRVGQAVAPVGRHDVLVPGQVADVRPWLHAADVSVNPMQSGSGSNLKVVEALAAGLPVVSTRFGLRGYDDLRPFVELAELDSFGAAIGRALTRPRTAPVEVLRRYSWEALAERQLAFYEEITKLSPDGEGR